MGNTIRILLICLVVGFFGKAAFASRISSSILPVEVEPLTLSKNYEISVRDELGPLKGALVWIESSAGELLAHGETTREGVFTVELENSAVSVTAYYEGHAIVSIADSKSRRVSISLPSNPKSELGTLEGKITGFKNPEGENKLMIGLLARALEFRDLMRFDVSSFLSPLKDEIDIFGKRELPSNVVLPLQTISVYFSPISFNKETYRFATLAGSSSRYFGLTGLLNVDDALDSLRLNHFWNVINTVEMAQVGISDPVQVAAQENKQLEIHADQVLQSDALVLKNNSIEAANGPGPTATSKRFAIALWEPSFGVFVPTDLKLVQDSEVSLNTVSSANTRIMDLCFDQGGDHVRGGWLDAKSRSLEPQKLDGQVDVDRWDGEWTLTGGEASRFIVAHAEVLNQAAPLGKRYEDRWILVSPKKGQFHFPRAAVKALGSQLGTIDHVSLDLLQTGSRGYPMMYGDLSAEGLLVFEKIRKSL